MRRDILFLVRGFPENIQFFDKHYFMAKPIELVVEKLREIAKEELAGLEPFLNRAKETGLACVGFRNDLPTQKEAVKKAWHQLAGMLDGVSFLIDEPPEVSEVVQVREKSLPDVGIYRYHEGGWAHFEPKSAESATVWKERNERLFHCLMRFFDLVADTEEEYQTDLGDQLRYSAKMFHQGALTKVWGIQYLCKFSALEGLVCGAEKYHKEAKLCSRLLSLFPSEPDLERTVKRLWGLRCEASHQGKAFHSDFLPHCHPLQIEIESLEFLFFGALVFALDHLGSVQTIEDLWPNTKSYALPNWALVKRPQDMPRWPISDVIIDPKLVWRGIGSFFDECFKRSAEALEKKS